MVVGQTGKHVQGVIKVAILRIDGFLGWKNDCGRYKYPSDMLKMVHLGHVRHHFIGKMHLEEGGGVRNFCQLERGMPLRG